MRIRVLREVAQHDRRERCRANWHSVERALRGARPSVCGWESEVVLMCRDLEMGEEFALPLCLSHAWAWLQRATSAAVPAAMRVEQWENCGQVIVPLLGLAESRARVEEF